RPPRRASAPRRPRRGRRPAPAPGTEGARPAAEGGDKILDQAGVASRADPCRAGAGPCLHKGRGGEGATDVSPLRPFTPARFRPFPPDYLLAFDLYTAAIAIDLYAVREARRRGSGGPNAAAPPPLT